MALSSAPAFSELVPADAGVGLRRVPSVAEAGTTLSNAVRGSKALANWLAARALDAKITASLDAQEGVIRRLLADTGQPGVLAFVEIEKAYNETGMLDLAANRVQVIGAGTQPGKVAIAYDQQKGLKPGPQSGTRIDEDASFYLWISQEGGGIRIRTTPAALIKLEVAHAFADKAYRDQSNEQSPAEAMKFAVAHLEATLVDGERKARLASLRHAGEQRQRNIDAVEKRLATELERQRRIQMASTILSSLANVGKLTNQIASLKAALGSDTPTSVDEAKSGIELHTILGDMLSESRTAGDKLRVRETEYRDDLKGTKIEILNVMRESSYPFDGVPQLEKPEITIR
jgi:hypothetical protein